MKWIILALSLIAPETYADQPSEQRVAPSNPAIEGATVAAELTSAYFDTREDCGKLSTPAFLCSGVLMRATDQSEDHHAWNPRPGSKGVSFSYIRKDANFDRLVFGATNGFIFYPYFSAPAGKVHPEILCSFPIEGYTWIRNGCGPTSYHPVDSDICQNQGITTAAQWKVHIDKAPLDGSQSSIHTYVCGFDVRNALNEKGGPAFYQSLLAMHEIPKQVISRYNELLLQPWPQDIPGSLPIQAFFYLEDGLEKAQHDQEDFYNATGGNIVPIIKLTLPAVVTGDAKFEYFPADQTK